MSKKNPTFLEKVGDVIQDMAAGMLNAGAEKKAIHPTKKRAKKTPKKAAKKAAKKSVKKTAPKKAAKKSAKKAGKK